MRHKTQAEASYFRRGGAPLSAMSGVAMVSEGVAWSDPGGGLGASAVDAMCSLSTRFSPILHSLACIQPPLPRRTFSFVLACCSHFLFYCCLVASSCLISARLRCYVRAASAFHHISSHFSCLFVCACFTSRSVHPRALYRPCNLFLFPFHLPPAVPGRAIAHG